MPEGRLIKRKITDSERFMSQPEPARLLFIFLFLWADKEGRHTANPRLLLSRFFPLDDHSELEMLSWLEGLNDAKKNGVGLIELYEVDKVKYLWLPGFLDEQSKTWLHGARNSEADSTIPPPPGWVSKERKQSGNKKIDKKDPDKYIKGALGHMVKR